MKIVVCYKWVLDEADIIVDREKQVLDTKRAKYKVSEIDRNALMLGSELADDDELVTLTAGATVKNSLKDVLSRGADKAYYIETPQLESAATAKVLAAAIKKIGAVDLVLCGEGSSDQYSQQVGPRIAALLNWSLVTYASSVTVANDQLTVVRKLEDDIETVSVQTPAVLSVVSEINQPKTPGMKQILAARKKPSEAFTIADLDLTDEVLTTPVKVTDVGPAVMKRHQVRLNEADVTLAQAAENLAELLKKNEIV
ncbi:MAG: electron transfer flavoprotein subunit beta/FixA family protein [Sporolactobacillus sp.]